MNNGPVIVRGVVRKNPGGGARREAGGGGEHEKGNTVQQYTLPPFHRDRIKVSSTASSCAFVNLIELHGVCLRIDDCITSPTATN